jgi:endonuclease YncB( thermonuclease family)
MTWTRRSCLSLISALVVIPAFALERGPNARVANITDGDTVTLAQSIEGASEVRLVGIQAPKLPLGRPNFPEWPLAFEAKAALEKLLAGKRVTLHFGETRRDRHGRLLAHLYTDDGVWVQGAMLKAGMVRVYTFPDNRARASEMYTLETEARAARRGIWAHPYYAVRAPEAAVRDIGTFQLVEGRVLDTARVRERVFLNFGPDWRTDFTIAIPTKTLAHFRSAGLDPSGLKGLTVRVRGWIKDENGPMIEVTHPEQIESLK